MKSPLLEKLVQEINADYLQEMPKNGFTREDFQAVANVGQSRAKEILAKKVKAGELRRGFLRNGSARVVVYY